MVAEGENMAMSDDVDDNDISAMNLEQEYLVTVLNDTCTDMIYIINAATCSEGCLSLSRGCT